MTRPEQTLNLTEPRESASASRPDALAVHNCTITFDTDTGPFTAVEDVDMTVGAGEKVMLLGPSGCGKSTLLKAFGGFLPLAGGTIELDGEAIGRPGPDRVLVFQDVNQLFPWRTVRSNIAFAARTVHKLDKAEAGQLADEYLSITGLSEFGDFYPHTLSGGMKQRAAIARAFVMKPKMLLMDEPFGALDAQTRQMLQLELNRLWRQTKTSLVFVTHSIDEAVRLGQRIVVMARDPGRILEVVDNEALHDEYLADIEAEPEAGATLRRDLRELLHVARGENKEADQ